MMRRADACAAILVLGLCLILLAGCGQASRTIHAPDPASSRKDTVTDIDGNLYRTVTIGNQTWMAENLKTTRYRNGDPIPNVEDTAAWTALATGGCCHCENDPRYLGEYGLLYNWHAAADNRGISPEGWHVPNREEWRTLLVHLGGTPPKKGGSWKQVGSRLKETGTVHWDDNADATDESGFAGRGAGVRVNMASGGGMNVMFEYFRKNGVFWTSTEQEAGRPRACCFWLKGYMPEVYEAVYGKFSGFSIRCVRD